MAAMTVDVLALLLATVSRGHASLEVPATLIPAMSCSGNNSSVYIVDQPDFVSSEHTSQVVCHNDQWYNSNMSWASGTLERQEEYL